MRLLRMKKIHEGSYLNNYELTYLNKGGREKVFELVSRSRLSCAGDIGRQVNGVTIVAFQDDRLLLLKEFRMSINKSCLLYTSQALSAVIFFASHLIQ